MVAKILHFDCFSGISGDMVLGALVDAGACPQSIISGVQSLGIPAELSFEKTRKNGICATQAIVETTLETKHRYLHQIESIIDQAQIPTRAKSLSKDIFRKLGEAEAKVHGMPLDKIHFHEVGAADSITDIVGAAIGVTNLDIDHFSSRSVPTGHGSIRCEHGVMPIPAPATAILLEGVPIASSHISKELTTPTGAAILTTLVGDWRETFDMKLTKVGCGAGTMDLPGQANILRVFLGESQKPQNTDTITLLETNLDDISPELVAYCMEELLVAGALDVYAKPVVMKKNRPGLILGVICKSEDTSVLENKIFSETGTFGIRKQTLHRVKLERESIKVTTRFGEIAAKKGWDYSGHGIITPEYEDCARVARLNKIPLREVYSEVNLQIEKSKPSQD